MKAWRRFRILPSIRFFLAGVVLGGWLAGPAAAELATNGPLQFFTTVSSRLLRVELGQELGNIQIYPTNQYTPAVHRLLQVAANLYETTPAAQPQFPTVYRPRFGVTNGTVHVSGYALVTNFSELQGLPLLDLASSRDPGDLIPADGNALVFGVPLVVGARQGLPNFNEYSLETLVTMTRKVQLRKAGNLIVETNQFFTLELTMPLAAEFWNSYATNFNQPVSLRVTNHTTFTLTNDLGVRFSQSFITGAAYATNDWPGFNGFQGPGNPRSFLVLMRTNVPLLPVVGYLPELGSGGFVNPTNVFAHDDSQELLFPRWGIAISNRLQALILGGGGEIIDHVLLGNLAYVTNLTDLVAKAPSGAGSAFEYLWEAHPLPTAPTKLTGRAGVMQQINISLGSEGDDPSGEWIAYGRFNPSNIKAAIAQFQQFFFAATNGFATVPFTPIAQLRIPMSWQANDPLVNDLAEVLLDRERSGWPDYLRPPVSSPTARLDNIGGVNRRYKPWPKEPGEASSDPHSVDPALKDPLVRTSDGWDFPSGLTLAIENLGRIHRGTPWQTLYLKSSDLGLTNIVATPAEFAENPGAWARWADWSGATLVNDAFYTRPVRDWSIVSSLVPLLNTNRPHDLLSVNEPDEAAWRAVLDGATVWTNVTTDDQLISGLNLWPQFDPVVLTSNSFQVAAVAAAIASVRTMQPGQAFLHLGQVLATGELSLTAPWLNQSSELQLKLGLTDAAYEALPAQLLRRIRSDSIGRVQLGDELSIRFTGWDGHAYAIERSPNLKYWTAFSTNYPLDGVIELVIPTANSSNCFYRSVLLP